MFTEKHKGTCGGHEGAPAGHLRKTGVSQHLVASPSQGRVSSSVSIGQMLYWGGGEGLFRFGTCRSQLEDHSFPLHTGTAALMPTM